jgi:hypothetical protein
METRLVFSPSESFFVGTNISHRVSMSTGFSFYSLLAAASRRWGLATIVDTLARLVLEIRNEVDIVLSGCSNRRVQSKTFGNGKDDLPMCIGND